jgi:hypothetical protein
MKKPANGFLSLIASPARRALASKGITTLQQLSKICESELLGLHGIVTSAITTLRNALKTAGLAFKKL